MKKNNLLLAFLLCCIYTQALELRGLPRVTPGSYVYYLDLDNVNTTTNYKIYCSTNGLLAQFDDIQGTITVTPNSSITRVIIVDWLEIGEGYIRVIQEDNPTKKAEIKISIVKPAPTSIEMITDGNPRQGYRYPIQFVNTTPTPIENIILPDGIREISHTDFFQEVDVVFENSGTQIYTIKANSYEFTRVFNVIPNNIVGAEVIASGRTETYNVAQLPDGAACTWSVSNNLQIISGQGVSSMTVQAIGEGDGFINASILGTVLDKHIAVGVPDIYKVEVSLGTGNTLYFYMPNRNECKANYTGNGTILEYEWGSPDWGVFNPLTSNNSTVFLKPKNSTTGSMANILIRARNGVGWSDRLLVGAMVNFNTSRSSYMIQSTTSGIVTITKGENQDYSLLTNIDNNNVSIGYGLYNQYTGVLVKQGHLDAIGETLDFSNLPNGIYILSLNIDSTTRQTAKIMIKH